MIEIIKQKEMLLSILKKNQVNVYLEYKVKL